MLSDSTATGFYRDAVLQRLPWANFIVTQRAVRYPSLAIYIPGRTIPSLFMRK
jgi:hypothetical protein